VTLGSAAERVQFEREHAGRYERAVFVARRPRGLEMLTALWYFATGRCVFRRLYFAPVQRAIDRAIAGGRFDAVYFSTVLLGYYRVPAGVRVVGDAHNIEHEVLSRAASIARNPLRKAFFHEQARMTARDERRLARKFSEVWATSARDAEHFAAVRGDRRVAVVPNGVRVPHETDADGVGTRPRENRANGVGNPVALTARIRLPTLETFPVPVVPPTLLFVGLMSYFPNADAVDFFLDAIFPMIVRRLPGVQFLIVGAAPSHRLRSRAAHNVSIVGRVPSVAPYFARITAFVVPLRAGGGTRVKVLEAMAHGVPVVSTTMGCEGLEVRDGESVLLADTPRAFADAVIRLSTDRALAIRIAAGGRALVRSTYDWHRIGDAVHTILGGHVCS
jgi:glycosyltransferase involved in cell wall biosynthesis